MSDALRTLRQGHREVNRLYNDVYPPAVARREWTASVPARRSLGDDVQVEAWYLAEHFLLAWSDWRGLRERYLRYFGQPENALPRSWSRLDARCRGLTSRLLTDSALDELIASSWTHTVPRAALLGAVLGHVPRCSRSLYHDIVTSHRRIMLQRTATTVSTDEAPPNEKTLPISQKPPWPKTFSVAQDEDARIVSMMDRLPRTLRDDTLMHLQNYQRSTLSVSWLLGSNSVEDARPLSALVQLLTKEKLVMPSIEQFVAGLNVEQDERRIVSRVLDRIQAAIAEVGYDNFVEDVTSGEFLGGPDTPTGSGEINIIPGHANGACCTTLLAVSKGEKRTVGFPSVMRQVREHLIRCMEKTRVVIILCDYWRPDMLNDHFGDLRAHYDRGVRFLFLLVGTPGRAVSAVAVDFAATL